MSTVDVGELRQNLCRHLDRVKAGDSLDVTEHGRVIARLSPAGDAVPAAYAGLATRFGATVPSTNLAELMADRPRRATPAGAADALLAEGRAPRA